MDLFEAVEQRRAVKNYTPQAVAEQDLKQIMQATILSPTSYNIQHWRFIRVTDKALRTQIKEAAWQQPQVQQAAELIIICANTQAWNDRPERYWEKADKDTQTVLLEMLDGFYRNKPQLQRDEAIRSASMAAQTLMLSAKALGYDTCPLIGFDPDKVAELINLPQDHIITMMLTLGKAEHPANPRGGQLSLEDIFFENRF